MWLKKPVLCEKPICKDPDELLALMAECRKAGTRLQMVSQYDYLVDRKSHGPSHWDYYKSGGDGLAWDCIQIIGHAKERPSLKNMSPIWSCMINGKPLQIEQMDFAYIWMIRDWLDKPRDDIDRILESHKAVAKWEADCKSAS